ncbi:MAG: DUF4340 domain-containing protein [Deltaproteobacteria bacterium]|nr:DUF4340 domain-containing protein [Deltaproteobacteria bacterium]
MNWKATIGALVVLLGVGAYYLLVAEPEHMEKVAKEAKKTVLTTFDDKDIQKIEVKKGQDAKPVTAERRGEKKWVITSPVQTRGDRYAWDGIARKMAKLKAKRFIKDSAGDLKPFGLDKPRVVVTATTKAGKVVSLLLGEDNKFDNTVFAKTADATRIVSVDKDVFSSADKDLLGLRDKKLLDFEQKDVQRFTVKVVHEQEKKGEEQSKKKTKKTRKAKKESQEKSIETTVEYTLNRKGDDWELEKPIKGPADKSTASSILSSISNIRAESFVKEKVKDLADAGIESPGLQVTIELKGKKEPLKVWVEKPKPGEEASKQELLATAGPGNPLAKIKGYIYKNVDKGLFQLRDKSLVKFDRKDVKKIVVRDKDVSYTLEAAGEPINWKITAPTTAPAKKYKVSSLLSSLSYLKAKEFAEESASDLSKYGLDKPDREITLFDKAGKELARLLIGKADGDVYYAKGAAQKRVSKLDKKAVDRWAWKMDDVQDKNKK